MRPRYSDIQISRRPGDEEEKPTKRKKDEPWKQELWDALLTVMSRGKEYTMDDLWDEYPLDPNDPDIRSKKLAGNSVMTKARTLGLHQDTGRSAISKQVTAHARKITIWEPIKKRRLVRIGESNGKKD